MSIIVRKHIALGILFCFCGFPFADAEIHGQNLAGLVVRFDPETKAKWSMAERPRPLGSPLRPVLIRFSRRRRLKSTTRAKPTRRDYRDCLAASNAAS